MGLVYFVDDIYIYGYLRQEDIVYNTNGGVQCTTGANGSASYIIEQIRTLVKYAFGKDNPNNMHTHIMHTVAINKNKTKGTILETIEKIERSTNVLEKWKEYNNVEEAVAAFVIKVDVSNVPLGTIENNISNLERKLLGIGYSIYCVDYTQDYSGTMQRDVLIEHFIHNFSFRMQGENDPNIVQNAKYTILDNVQSVGNNVLSFIYENPKTKNLHRSKLYNKIVSNMEAGEVRSSFGGHLADYEHSSNERLRKIFAKEEVQKRGVTRLEVSVYGNQQNITEKTGRKIIQNILDMVTPKNEKLFVIQEAKQQWRNLAEKISKCFALVDRPNQIIYIAWYANTITNRIAGTKIDYSKSKTEDLETFVEWAISDFGFKMVPIFRADILEVQNKKKL